MKTIKYMVGKVNMFDFVSKEIAREVMTGVYHENGYKIASDGKILFAVKSDYTEELEERCLMPDGNVKELEYPKWKQVCPFYGAEFNEQEWMDIPVLCDEFTEWVKNNRAIKRDVYGKSKTWYDEWAVYGGGCSFFKAQPYYTFSHAAKSICADSFHIHKERPFCAFAKSDLGCVLIMPIFMTEEVASQKIEDEEIDVFPLI